MGSPQLHEALAVGGRLAMLNPLFHPISVAGSHEQVVAHAGFLMPCQDNPTRVVCEEP